MKIFGFEFGRQPEQKLGQFEDVLARIVAAQDGGAGTGMVTPETCMQSPTVHAIVTAISRRISVSPVRIYRKTTTAGRDSKEPLPDHPVARLLQRPNQWQSRVEYWQDAASSFARHGCFYAWKARGTTGPIRELLPIKPDEITVKQNRLTWAVTYERDGEELDPRRVHHVRGPARDFVRGNSPVRDVCVAIALEILAEKFGASFFQNGALPFLVFSFLHGGFKDPADGKQFISDFQEAFGGGKRFRALLLPKGVDKPTPVPIENDKAQFLETRKYQRTVIAGAWGVPPHLVGDLERATFNNVEQQDSDFTLNVIMPIAQAFEAAMERDLLSDDDRAGGVAIRFNLDSILRADFKSRQEGLRIQRDAGVRSPNEWREIEGLNPIAATDGGEDYLRPANMVVAGKEDEQPQPGANAPPRDELPRDESGKGRTVRLLTGSAK